MRTIAASLLMLLPLAGCIQLEQTLTLKNDGSGQFAVEYSLSEQTIEQIRAMYKLRQDLDQAAGRPAAVAPGARLLRLYLDPVEADLRNELKPYERAGVTAEKLKVESRGSERYVSLKLNFASLTELAKTDLFRSYGFSLARGPGGLYEMTHIAPGPKQARNADYTDAEATKLLAPVMGGFRAHVTAQVPGAIQKTNATRHSERTAVWTFDFADDPFAFVQFQQADLRIVFDGRGLDLPEVKQEAAPSGL